MHERAGRLINFRHCRLRSEQVRLRNRRRIEGVFQHHRFITTLSFSAFGKWRSLLFLGPAADFLLASAAPNFLRSSSLPVRLQMQTAATKMQPPKNSQCPCVTHQHKKFRLAYAGGQTHREHPHTSPTAGDSFISSATLPPTSPHAGAGDCCGCLARLLFLCQAAARISAIRGQPTQRFSGKPPRNLGCCFARKASPEIERSPVTFSSRLRSLPAT
jgi:hypothetical protein